MKKIHFNVNIKQYLKERKNRKKSIRNGSYSMGISVIVIAIIVVINLVIQEIPVQYREFDLSESKVYTIGEQTEKMLDELDQDVSLYLIAQDGTESTDILNILERYEGASDHITVKTIDPAVNPNFTSQYTQEQVTSNSIIAVCGERSKVISYNDMFETEVDYTTYSSTVTGFDGEGQITSAIDYVTAEDLPTMYVIEGHNEASMSDSLTSAIQKENINIESLNLLTQDSVPEDADCLFLYSPTVDYASDEAQKILTYLENGGKAIIISSYTEEDMPNFMSIVENYGVTVREGAVLERDTNHYISQNPFYLLPEINSTDITSELAQEGRYILIPYAQGIEKTENSRSTLTIEELLTTSAEAFSKVNVTDMTTVEKEEGDIDGPFALGVSISEKLDEDKETQIVYFSSEGLLDETVNANVSGSNYALFTSALSWMCEHEESISVPVKDMELSYLTIPASDVHMWSIFSIGVLPAVFLIAGGCIWFKRRKQ